MGNCLGRASSGNFKGQGRTLGSSAGPPARPQQAAASSQAAATTKTTGGQGRTVGVPSGVGGSGGGGGGDARSAAARAAEERAARERDATQRGGKLAHKLAAQKARTAEDTLRDGAATERRQREVDQGTKALAHG